MSTPWRNGLCHVAPIEWRWSAGLRRTSNHGFHRTRSVISSSLLATRSPVHCVWHERLLSRARTLPDDDRDALFWSVQMSEMDRGVAAEFKSAPAAVEQQGHMLAAPLAELVTRLVRKPPQIVVTCARGSSAHAATFGKHLIELHRGIPVAAAAPNIAAVYHRKLRLKNQVFLAISQSGRSDDLVESAEMAKAAGALTVAI